MVSENKSNIKFKVVTGYIFVFIAIFASVLIANQSYNKLLDSVVYLSKPDAEIARMNRILTNLSEAENKIRIYSLTKKERYLANYAENIIEIDLGDDHELRWFANLLPQFIKVNNPYRHRVSVVLISNLEIATKLRISEQKVRELKKKLKNKLQPYRQFLN